MADHAPRADDQTLIAEALEGDEDALDRLLRQDQEWAYNVAYRVLGQEADARDAVQDAFLLTVRAIRGDVSPPRSHDAYRAWLRRVVVNSALTQVRRRPPVHAVPVDDVAESLPDPDHPEPSGTTDQAETRERVLQVLLSLPETQRVALALKEYLDASYEEIADALEIPRTAVGTLLFRARTAFRAAYDRVSETAPPIACPDLVPLFSAIVDEERRPAAWSHLEDHLHACERCQGELDSQRRARRLYALLPLFALPAAWDPVNAALGGAAAGAAASSAGHAGTAASNAGQAGMSAGGAGTASGVSGGSGAAAGGAASTGGGAAGTAGAGGAPPLPLPADPGSAALAGHAVGAAAPAAAAAPMAAPVAAGVSAAAASGATAGGGLLAGVAGVKMTLAALATAGVIGAAVVASPLTGTGSAPIASPAPSPGLAAPPVASPASLATSVSTTAAGAAASPSPAVLAVGPIIFPTASPSPTPAPLTPPPTSAPGPATQAAPAPSPAPSPAP